MNEQEHLKTLTDIKNLMERSSRFLSLSGRSGIFIGCYALAGALLAGWYLNNNQFEPTSYHSLATSPLAGAYRPYLPFLIAIAVVVMLLSLLTAYIFTQRIAKKQGLKVWDTSSRRLVVNLSIPLVTGGIFTLIILHHYGLGMVAPCLLIFYGLSLLNASKYTYNDIRYLGIAEIITGIFAALYSGYGLHFWALGFGVMHIIYGIAMYYKYER